MSFQYKRNGYVHLQSTIESFLQENGNDHILTYERIRAYVGQVECVHGRYLSYKRNVNGSRVARPVGDAIWNPRHHRLPHADDRTMHEACLAHLYAVSRQMRDEQRDDMRDDYEPPREEPKDEEIPAPPKDEPKPKQPHEDFLQWCQSVRKWQIEQDIEQWGYRQAINGAKLLTVGFPVEAIKDGFTIDWDPEARRFHNVQEFDLIAWGRTIAEDGQSAMEAVVRCIAKAGVNSALVGGRGIGKTTTIENMSEKDDVPLCVVSCNPETAGAEFFGILTPNLGDGFVLSEFTKTLLKAEQGEQVAVLLDEMDAMDSATALMLNRALEQRRISHRYLGRTIDFGENVTFYGAMNTTGNGGNDEFTGREKQDTAFLDRFFRVRVGCDEALEREIFASIIGE